MNESVSIRALAVDGGGSRCRMALSMGGQVTTVETGSANVYTDFDGAVAQINLGLAQLAKSTGATTADLAETPAFLGLAGVSSQQVAHRLESALPFKNVRIDDDRPAALRGALGPSDGAIIHCGTGSFFGFQKAGKMRFAGGWGSIIGDEASAKWLGWSALNRALRSVDGTLPSSTFAQSLVDDLGGIDPVLQFAASATPEEFGALAPRVTEAASAGSSFAQAILRDGAHHVASAVTALGWQETMPLCLTGGVAIHYRDYLPASVARALRDPLGEPINGALSLAKEVANGSL